MILAVSGCSRQQSDWQKTREANTTDAYEQFLKKYPSGEFSGQAQARVKELYEERDWQKARDADTPEAYQAFLKQYPEGKWTEEARIRVENFTLAQAPAGTATGAPGEPEAGEAAPPPGAPAIGVPPSAAKARAPAPPAAATSAAAGARAAAPVAAAPVPAPTSTAPTRTAAAAEASTHRAKSGHYGVQLGAFKSGAGAAKERWARLQQQYPTLLAGLSSKVVPKKTTSGGNLYRLQALGLSEKHAREVCSALRAKSQPCMVVPPAHG
jgi:cell division protein FtsN